MGTKAELRLSLKNKLEVLKQSEHLDLSNKVSLNLQTLLNDLGVIQKNLVIGVFAPIQQEPKWFLKLDERVLKHSAYPAFVSGNMEFRLSAMADLVETTSFGVSIFGPVEGAKVVAPEIIIVPGLGFDKSGKRLGRGKGFYDKYLEENSAIKIAVAFEMQMEKEIPVDPHDIKMDFVVTDQNVYTTNR